MKEELLLTIFRSPNTVFTFKDIALLWGETNTKLVQKRIYRYVTAGKLYPIRRGIYAKDKNYDRYELATKIYTPAYISFETVLRSEGVIFQHYERIFVASYLTREIACDEQIYDYKKLKNIILFNNLGLIRKGNYTIACKERAFLDALYLYKNYHFDNLNGIDWNLCFKLLPIYKNKSLEKKLQSYYDDAHRS